MFNLDEQKKPEVATEIIKQKIAGDHQHIFEAWLKKISNAAQRHPGYLGVETLRPLSKNSDIYTCIFRFDKHKNMEKWLASFERKTLLIELDEITSSKPMFHTYIGLATWLYPTTKHNQPSRHKMALTTFLSIWALVHIAMNYIHPFIPGSDLIREMLVIAIIVLIMTYMVTPLLMKLLSAWLYK